jgi:hypothetical protein
MFPHSIGGSASRPTLPHGTLFTPFIQQSPQWPCSTTLVLLRFNQSGPTRFLALTPRCSIRGVERRYSPCNSKLSASSHYTAASAFGFEPPRNDIYQNSSQFFPLLLTGRLRLAGPSKKINCQSHPGSVAFVRAASQDTLGTSVQTGPGKRPTQDDTQEAQLSRVHPPNSIEGGCFIRPNPL